MQGFRARSQLVVHRLEDSDEVLQKHFSDDEEEDGDEESADASSSDRSVWHSFLIYLSSSCPAVARKVSPCRCSLCQPSSLHFFFHGPSPHYFWPVPPLPF